MEKASACWWSIRYLVQADPQGNLAAVELLSEHFRTRFRSTDRPETAGVSGFSVPSRSKSLWRCTSFLCQVAAACTKASKIAWEDVLSSFALGVPLHAKHEVVRGSAFDRLFHAILRNHATSRRPSPTTAAD